MKEGFCLQVVQR